MKPNGGVSPFRDRPTFMARKTNKPEPEEEDRSISAPVKRPSLLTRTLSHSSMKSQQQNGDSESALPQDASRIHEDDGGRTSSNPKQRPASFLARRRSKAKMTPEDMGSDRHSMSGISPAKERRSSALRKSGRHAASSGRISPPKQAGPRPTNLDGKRAASSKALVRTGSRNTMSIEDGQNHDENGQSPDQIIMLLKKKLSETERLVTACQGKITEYQTKLAMFRAEKLEIEMKISKQEHALKKSKFPKDTRVQVNLSFDAIHPVWAEATVIEHDQVAGTFVLSVENFGEVDSVPEDKVRHAVLAPEHEKVYEFDDELDVGAHVEITTGVDQAGNKQWSLGTIVKRGNSNTYDVELENKAVVEDVPRNGLRPVQ